jgi:hypothetical protein
MPNIKWIAVFYCVLSLTGLCAITRIVDISGSGQYTSIQAAVNDSAPGDTILVYPGRYLGLVIIGTDNISLISQEAITNNPVYIDSTIIDGNGLQSIRVLSGKQSIVVRGFSLTNGRGVNLLSYSSSRIVNCKIFDNEALDGGGMYLSMCTVTLSGVKVYDNYAYRMGGGIYIYGYMGSVNVIFDPINLCSIYNNRAGSGQDIFANSLNSDLTIPLETFTVSESTSYYASILDGNNNNFQVYVNPHNSVHQEIASDLYVSTEGDDANDGLSLATPLKTIGTAIYRISPNSANSRTVHILPGVYATFSTQEKFPIALKGGVTVKGAGMAETQVIGEMDPVYANITRNTLFVFAGIGQDNFTLQDLSITTQNYTSTSAVWGLKEDGMVLRNLRMHNLSPNEAAVIDLSKSTNVLMENVIIEDFSTPKYGFLRCEGIFTGRISDCIFRNATSTYVSNDVWARALILLRIGSFITIENSIFTNLTMMDDDSQALSFGGNTVITEDQTYTINNTLFSNIHCNLRGVIFGGINYPIMNFNNCTFAGHTGNGEALMVNGIVTIFNSIFYNNRSKEIAINPMDFSGLTTTLTLHNNLIRNGYDDIWQGPQSTIHYHDTNISGDPQFLAWTDINDPLCFRLSNLSPCIDSGALDSSGLGLLPYDLAGNYRIWNNRIDMGCYEYGSEPWVSNDDPVAPEIPAISLTAYPNPFSAFTNIKVNLQASEGNGIKSMNDASIHIYNLKGQKVKSIKLDPRKTSEQFTYWDGRDTDNNRCASGIYFINLAANGRSISSKKVTFIR